MDIHGWWDTAVPIITTVGIRIVGAGILYIIGRWLIGLAVSLVSRVLTARSFDATLQRYVVNILAAGHLYCSGGRNNRKGWRRQALLAAAGQANGASRRRSARRNRAAEVSPGSNSQRGRRSSARCGNSGLQHIGDLVGGTPLLPYRPLLAGLFRHQQFDRSHLRHRRLSGALCGSGTPRRANREIAASLRRLISSAMSWAPCLQARRRKTPSRPRSPNCRPASPRIRYACMGVRRRVDVVNM